MPDLYFFVGISPRGPYLQLRERPPDLLFVSPQGASVPGVPGPGRGLSQPLRGGGAARHPEVPRDPLSLQGVRVSLPRAASRRPGARGVVRLQPGVVHEAPAEATGRKLRLGGKLQGSVGTSQEQEVCRGE